MNETQQTPTTPRKRSHRLLADDRGEITVSGVTEVLSFDDENVRLVTTCGILNLEGQGLRIHVLNTGDGTVAVTGQLNGVLYEDPDKGASAPSERSRPRSRRLFG
jgi:sporulation protein YabP